MQNFLERLKTEILICDGAMGTMLQAEGLALGQPPDLWNITHPEAVKKIHSSYKEAGADILITNTFGSNRIKLEKAKLADKIREINTSAVNLAKEAAQENCFVFGDVGPTGALLKPIGDLEYNKALDNFLEQISILKDAKVDAVIIETMSDLAELRAAISAAKKNKDIPVIASMTFQKTKKGFRTMMGVDIKQAVNLMEEECECDIIGTNCGVGLDEMIDIISEMRKLTKIFLIAQPNAGMPQLVEGKTIFTQSPLDFKRKAKDLIRAGVNIIGGCCGTTPKHIAQLKKEAINA